MAAQCLAPDGEGILPRSITPAWGLEVDGLRCKVEALRRKRSCHTLTGDRPGRDRAIRPVHPVRPSAILRPGGEHHAPSTLPDRRLCLILLAALVPGRRAEGREAEGDLLGHPAHPLGGGGLQDPRGIPRHGPGEHPQGDAAPEGAARLPVHARPGGVRPAVPGAVSRPRRPISAGSWPRGDCSSPARSTSCPTTTCRAARRSSGRCIYGKGYYRDKLGVDVTTRLAARHLRPPRPDAATAWRSADTSRFWFFRGVPRQDFPSEFIWEGIDGTRIDAYWLPHGYGLVYPNAEGPAGIPRSRCMARFHALTPNSRGCGRPRRPVGRRRLRARGAPRPERRGVQQGPQAAVHDQGGRARRLRGRGRPSHRPDGLQGGAEPDLPGDLQQPDRAQGLDADRSSGSCSRRRSSARSPAWLGSPADPAAILAAWEPVLFNQTHDLASGVMTDHVYEDTIRSYEYAKRRSDEIYRRELGRPGRRGSTPAGRGRRSSSSIPWAGRARTSPRSRSASAKGASPSVERDRPRRPGRAGPDPRVDPIRRRRTEDGADRLHRPRRPRPGIRHLSRRPGPSTPASRPRPGDAARPRSSWRTTSIG